MTGGIGLTQVPDDERPWDMALALGINGLLIIVLDSRQRQSPSSL